MIIVTADWHLDQKEVAYNSNVRDKEADFIEVAKQLNEAGHQGKHPVYLVIAGDLFDNNKPKPQAVSFFRELYDKHLSFFTKIFILKGNHENNDTNKDALDYIETWHEERIQIIRTIQGLKIDHRKIFLLPHLDRTTLRMKPGDDYDECVSQELHGYIKQISKCDLIIGHGTVKGAKVGTEQYSLKRAIKFPAFNKTTILGHIHKPQQLRQVHYVGSPIYTDFAEIGDKKGYIVVDNKIVHIKHFKNLQKYEVVKLNMQKDYRFKMPKCSRKAIYKIEIQTTKELRAKINTVKIKQAFNKIGFVQSMNTVVEKDIKKKSETGSVNLERFSPKNILRSWINKNVKATETKKKLYNRGREILDEVS